MKRARGPVHNRLLETLPASERDLIAEDLRVFSLERGDVLFEPGQDVANTYFPGSGTIAALILDLREGAAAEAAMIGYEGAIGGVISDGDKPAFARGVVQMPGPSLRLATDVLASAQRRSAACATISPGTRIVCSRKFSKRWPAIRPTISMRAWRAGC
jgi:CRP-like cAMP-binding protein